MALPATWQETAGGWFGVVMLMLAAVYCTSNEPDYLSHRI